MSCKHGNWPPCDQCDEEDDLWNRAYKSGYEEGGKVSIDLTMKHLRRAEKAEAELAAARQRESVDSAELQYWRDCNADVMTRKDHADGMNHKERIGLIRIRALASAQKTDAQDHIGPNQRFINDTDNRLSTLSGAHNAEGQADGSSSNESGDGSSPSIKLDANREFDSLGLAPSAPAAKEKGK